MEWHCGIDTAAHKGCLKAGGKTIAVFGGGFEHIFPKENYKLYKKILENEGAVITEYASNIKPQSNQFLERNRIISGMSIGVFVIEATHRSGTSVTAKIAKQQGKKIFALPHEIKNINGVGTNRLLQNGAILVTKVEDIIQQYPFLKYNQKKENNKKIKNKKQPPEQYREIYQIIKENPSSVNMIYQKSAKNVGEINQILLMLEIEGYIQKNVGGYKCI